MPAPGSLTFWEVCVPMAHLYQGNMSWKTERAAQDLTSGCRFSGFVDIDSGIAVLWEGTMPRLEAAEWVRYQGPNQRGALPGPKSSR